MGYRDDFYIAGNVIGYTGDIKNNPTVYFESNSEYGRITQDYPWDRSNEGRNKVRSNEGHSMANEMVEEELQLVERQGGKVTHTSRNAFVAIGGLGDGDKALLYQSITKYPNLKAKY